MIRISKNAILFLNLTVLILIYINANTNKIQKLNNNNGKINSYNCTSLEKRFPKAIIIGPKKTGTGALLKFIGAHPQIAAKEEEVYFLDVYFNKGYEWYR
jgi:hypothetical protein